jgi:hypothetical protein
VSVKDIAAFKSEHSLEPGDHGDAETDLFGPRIDNDEPDLRAEDEALVAAALEAEQEEEPEPEPDSGDGGSSEGGDGEAQKPRRRGRRGGRGRGRGRKPLDGTFDHGEDGYGLWLDPAVQDNPLYAEHWAGHRPVKVEVEADRIVITRAGDGGGNGGGDDASEDDK